MLKVIEAGCDQFGGEMIPEMLVKLVKEGKVKESRLDESVKRILKDKFRLGLFENPYVDVENAMKVVGKEDFRKDGLDAQRKSLVLLKNSKIGNSNALPLRNGMKVYVKGIERKLVEQYATVVNKPEDADFAIIRLSTPYEPMEGFIEKLFHHGDLDFKGEEKEEILELLAKVPTIVDLYIDRPAVIPEIADKCAGLIVNFGATDSVILEAIFGKFSPTGKLPVELPSSMEAVRNQKEDVPYDSKDPLFPFGSGISY
jgi:beta-glucosidase